MRVYVSSVPEELEAHQALACEIARELGLDPVVRDPGGLLGFLPVAACARQVAASDRVLVLVGHRRGGTPAAGDGGDGYHPWAWWETRAAFERGLPVAVAMAAETWRPGLREDRARARAVMRDFRGELARLAVFFDGEDEDELRDLLRRQLSSAQRQTLATMDLGVGLRRWPPPRLPARPYPMLLPYTHPDLLAGRDRELAELRRLLAQPVPIVGLHAPSGVGKSSLLAGGLVPALRADGRPVAFDRHPGEPDIARRLLGDLLANEPANGRPSHSLGPRERTPSRALPMCRDDDPQGFVDRLRAVLRLASAPAVLVLDQFEDLLRFEDAARARATVGTLMAASVQRQPGLAEPPCRWLLAYRQEFHGQVFQWLTDILRDARTAGDPAAAGLPHDLSRPDRFQAWALPPLAAPAPGAGDRAEDAARIFRRAIEKPLALSAEDGAQVYPWRFAGDGAARLARAFGEARARQRNAPLVPELQVVLAHLLERSASRDGVRRIEVPDDPGQLIDQALEEHLRRSLDAAFPPGRKTETRLRRTRALLALRQLADAHGRRDEGRPVAALARAIGRDGHDVLERLATPQTRLVLLEGHGDDRAYVLSHDRLAEVVVRLVDDQGTYAGLGVDAELLGLRRFVALQRELYAAGEVEQSTAIPKSIFSGIERHADALLWDDEGRRWWAACRERRSDDRRRTLVRGAGAVAAVVLVIAGVRLLTDRAVERQALLDRIAFGEPEVAFATLDRLSAEVGAAELLARARQREQPLDVLEKGLAGVADERHRGAAVLRVAELLLPLLREEPEDPVRVASTVWALDFFAARDPELADRAAALRDEALAPLRRRRRPPPPPPAADPGWADIPAGDFWMGVEPGAARDEDEFEEWPKHRVTLSRFRLMTHEVTTAEYRRLVPGHRPDDAPDVPVVRVTWYQAYTYAAWLGGRLPTEAEWEYAARAGCAVDYCDRDGGEATLSEVGWWPGNSVDPSSGEPRPRAVGKLEPNPWGLHDVYGNVLEWTATWAGPYPEQPQVDPLGPPGPPPSGSFRIVRGGAAAWPAQWATATRRAGFSAGSPPVVLGLRVVVPAADQSAGSTTRKP